MHDAQLDFRFRVHRLDGVREARQAVHTHGDGFGNLCNADLNNDGVINVVDLGLMRSVFFAADEDADLNGDGIVNAQDLGLLRASFFGAPGPSGLNP
ncbi:MAG: dockerin type I domain-containing protein [Gammaproteobacteria bacterium]